MNQLKIIFHILFFSSLLQNCFANRSGLPVTTFAKRKNTVRLKSSRSHPLHTGPSVHTYTNLHVSAAHVTMPYHSHNNSTEMQETATQSTGQLAVLVYSAESSDEIQGTSSISQASFRQHNPSLFWLCFDSSFSSGCAESSYACPS